MIKEKLNIPTEEQLNLLGDFLYFGCSEKQDKIFSNKHLTSLIGIANIFIIDKNDLYQNYNKIYNSINFGYDLWNKSPKFLKNIQHKVKIYNNAKDWIETNGKSYGFIHRIKLTDYIKNNLRLINDSDIRYEVLYIGKKEIEVDFIKKSSIEWTCIYSPDMIAKYGEACFIGKYEPPYSIEVLKEKYPYLLKNKVHLWRARNQIELIHKEPTYDEQKRIFYNWNAMTKKDKERSDRKCKEFFGRDNLENHSYIIEKYWNFENYLELSRLRTIYDNRDMVLNGLNYIHLSKTKEPLLLNPRIPKTIMENIEDSEIPRICISTSIFGAIAAISDDSDKIFYVHSIENVKNILKNEETNEFVPDALSTGECWLLDYDVKTKVVGKITLKDRLSNIYTFFRISKNNFLYNVYYDYELLMF